jgi:hypothetical protein
LPFDNSPIAVLPDLDTQRCERLFFALRLDHDVCFPTVEGI